MTLINSTHIKHLEGGYVIKQGDYASNFKFKLLDELKNDIDNINGAVADIVLCDELGEVIYTTAVKVMNSSVEFYIKEKLNPGEYLLEIHAGGYIFPSNNKFKIVVNHSSRFTKEEKKDTPFLELDTSKLESIITEYSKINIDGLPIGIVERIKSTGVSVDEVKFNFKSKVKKLIQDEINVLNDEIETSKLDYGQYNEILNKYRNVDLTKGEYDSLTIVMSNYLRLLECQDVYDRDSLDVLVISRTLDESIKFDVNRECIYSHDEEIELNEENVEIQVDNLIEFNDLVISCDVKNNEYQGALAFGEGTIVVRDINQVINIVLPYAKTVNENVVTITGYKVKVSNIKVWGVRR